MALFYFNNMKIQNTQFIIIAFLAINSISCSTSNTKKYNKSPTTTSSKSKIPRVPAKILPGGTGDNWRYIGISKDGLIGTEIDNSSIIAISNNQYKFQERKTIMDTNKMSYPSGMPKYMYSISNGKIDCNSKQYILNSTTLYDRLGKLIRTTQLDNQYTNIVSKSSAEQEYNFICNGLNRNIGY